MANADSLAAAGRSLQRFLDLCFSEAEPVVGSNTKAVLARTDDLKDFSDGTGGLPALTLFLYRVDFDKTMRASWAARGHLDGRSHLPLDLHFLLTPWAANATDEYRILGRAMQCLDSTPMLAGPLLHPSGDWAAADSLQVVLEELSTEAVMRTFDSLPVDYRLSVPYVLRVVRVDGRSSHPSTPATSVVTGVRPQVEPAP